LDGNSVSKQLFDSSGDVEDILPTPFKKAQGSIETDTVSSKTLHNGWWQLMIPELNNSRHSTQEVFKLPNNEWTSSVPVIESTINTIHQELRDDQTWAAVELDRIFGSLNAISSNVSSIDQKVVLLSLLVGKRPKHLNNDHEIITLWDAIDRVFSNLTHMEEGMILDQVLASTATILNFLMRPIIQVTLMQ
jgi:hypothetical protein